MNVSLIGSIREKPKLNRTTAMDLSLPTPDAFPMFPYTTPYQIQLQLMRHLFMAIEGQKFAILESPTGTARTRGTTRLNVSHDPDTGKIPEFAHWSPDVASGRERPLSKGDYCSI